MEQINNQQNNRDKHPNALPFQFGLLFEVVFDDVKEDKLNRNVASQARMMPLMRCCVLSSGGLRTNHKRVASGIRQTTSQRRRMGLDMVCVQEIKRALYLVVFQTSVNQAIIRFI